MKRRITECPEGYILVHRKGGKVKGHKGYKRKAYSRKDGTRVKSSSVRPGKDSYRNPTDYCMIDKGTKGRGKKLPFTEKKGKMTNWAIKLGYIDEDQHISDIPNDKIDDFAIDLAEHLNPKTAYGMFHAMVVKRKNAERGTSQYKFKNKMKIGRDAISSKFSGALTPVKAIKKWKSMTTEERRRRRRR